MPACQDCNSKKQSKEWHAYVAERAGANTAERYKRIQEFLKHYDYAPDVDLRDVAEELYAEVGSIAMVLVSEKVERVRSKP